MNCCYCSVTKSCLSLCDLTNCSTPGFSVHHYLPGFAQAHVRWVSDIIQSSHPLSHLALNFPQHQGLFQWVNSLHWFGQSIEASASASVLPKHIQCWWYHFNAESEELKSFLMKVKEESEKTWLKTQHSKN